MALQVPRLYTVDTRALTHIMTHSAEYQTPEVFKRLCNDQDLIEEEEEKMEEEEKELELSWAGRLAEELELERKQEISKSEQPEKHEGQEAEEKKKLREEKLCKREGKRLPSF